MGGCIYAFSCSILPHRYIYYSWNSYGFRCGNISSCNSNGKNSAPNCSCGWNCHCSQNGNSGKHQRVYWLFKEITTFCFGCLHFRPYWDSGCYLVCTNSVWDIVHYGCSNFYCFISSYAYFSLFFSNSHCRFLLFFPPKAFFLAGLS